MYYITSDVFKILMAFQELVLFKNVGSWQHKKKPKRVL